MIVSRLFSKIEVFMWKLLQGLLSLYLSLVSPRSAFSAASLLSLPIIKDSEYIFQEAVFCPVSLWFGSKVLPHKDTILQSSIPSSLALSHLYPGGYSSLNPGGFRLEILTNHLYSGRSRCSVGPLPRNHYDNFVVDHQWVWSWSWTGNTILCVIIDWNHSSLDRVLRISSSSYVSVIIYILSISTTP